MTNINNDPALRSPEQRQHIAAAAASRAAMHEACTRRTCTAAEAVSWKALADKYPQVERMLADNDRLRDAAGDVATDLEMIAESLAPLWSMRARRLDEAAEKLRVAMTRQA